MTCIKRTIVIAATVLLVLGSCTSEAETPTAFTSPLGNWEVTFPSDDIDRQTITESGLTFEIGQVSFGGDEYAVSEFALPPDATFDLNSGVDGSVQGSLGAVQEEFPNATAALLDTQTGTFEGFDSVEFTAELRADDDTAIIEGIIFLAGDVVTQVFAIDTDDDNGDRVAAFVDSLAPAGT